MSPRSPLRRSFLDFLAAGLLLAGCGASAEETSPTIPVEQIQTQAVATFASGLTATALAQPTVTPTVTPTLTPTFAPAITITPSSPAPAVTPVASCYGLTFVSDVTIPDDTHMDPEEDFTKTWQVRNSGTCAWEAGFRLSLTGGEAMGGSSVQLASAVEPGNTANISVELQAPATAGTFRGNWRMANAGGTFFGDELYVQIIVDA